MKRIRRWARRLAKSLKPSKPARRYGRLVALIVQGFKRKPSEPTTTSYIKFDKGRYQVSIVSTNGSSTWSAVGAFPTLKHAEQYRDLQLTRLARRDGGWA